MFHQKEIEKYMYLYVHTQKHTHTLQKMMEKHLSKINTNLKLKMLANFEWKGIS